MTQKLFEIVQTGNEDFSIFILEPNVAVPREIATYSSVVPESVIRKTIQALYPEAQILSREDFAAEVEYRINTKFI